MKTIRPEQCSPSKTKKKFSCYSTATLHKLKNKWNSGHSDKIVATQPQQIWRQLNEKFKNCVEESCWAKNLGINVGSEFSPKSPASWNSKPNEWLSSDEITNVMQQYEAAYNNFEYIGPSPSDYFFIENGKCVWPELCAFNIHKCKQKVGVVFNLDEHAGPGTHWVSLFIDKVKRKIYYFDSTGDPIHKNIEVFVKKIQKQDSRYKFKQNSPTEHQMGNTECGMYTLFFIITMLKYNDFSLFKNKGIFTDKKIMELRKKYFNES